MVITLQQYRLWPLKISPRIQQKPSHAQPCTSRSQPRVDSIKHLLNRGRLVEEIWVFHVGRLSQNAGLCRSFECSLEIDSSILVYHFLQHA